MTYTTKNYNLHISHSEEARNQQHAEERARIPVCENCNIHCSICARNRRYGKCCLKGVI